MKKYKIIAMAMTAGAVLLIIAGIVIVSKSTGGGFPLTAGSPIWAGSLVRKFDCQFLLFGQDNW